MKKRAFLLLSGLLVSTVFAFSQVPKDTLRQESNYLNFSGDFSSEESWQIHREAYKKQLESQGLKEKEIKKKLAEYDEKKDELSEKIRQQKKQAEIQMQKADEERKQAEILRQKADEQRKQAEILKLKADTLRLQADEQRNQVENQRQQADEHRKQAEVLRLKAEEHRKYAEEQRKEADIQRQKADELRKLAEEWKKSFKNLYSESITFSMEESKIKLINIKIDNKNTIIFNIHGYINSGDILIEIFDPNGKNEGTMALEHQGKPEQKVENGISNNTSGSLNKTINEPLTGDWSVRISPQKADSNIDISVAQFVKPAVNE